MEVLPNYVQGLEDFHVLQDLIDAHGLTDHVAVPMLDPA